MDTLMLNAEHMPDFIYIILTTSRLKIISKFTHSDELRARAWPKLVGLSCLDINSASNDNDDDNEPNIKDVTIQKEEKDDIENDDVVVVHKDNEGNIEMTTEQTSSLTEKEEPESTAPITIVSTNDYDDDNSDNDGSLVASLTDENDFDITSNEALVTSVKDNESGGDHSDNNDVLTVSITNENVIDGTSDDKSASPSTTLSADSNGDGPIPNEDHYESSSTASSSLASFSSRCLDAEQIDRDVVRCTWHLVNGPSQRALRRDSKNSDEIEALLKQKQRQLGRLINMVFLKSYKEVQVGVFKKTRSSRRVSLETEKREEDEEQVLRYYQGYHDVASVFLSAMGGGSEGEKVSEATDKLDLPISVLLQVSNSHLRDAMRSGFHHLCTALRLIILPLIGALDSQVHAKLLESQMEPFFAISWIITWFSHDIRDTDSVKRLFDVFIVSHPLMPIYMSIAMVLHPVNRMQVLETEVDFAAMHNTLTNLPKNSCTVGWRVLSEGGYVSGDDEGQEDFMPVDDAYNMPGETHNTTEDKTNPNAGHIQVPFQDLIEMAISFMRRIPPRNLMRLARRYYINTPSEHLLDESSSIALFQPPPSWGLASEAPTDEWILDQQEQESQDGLPSHRRPIRNEIDCGCGNGGINKADTDGAKKRFFDALVASGMGPDGEEEDRLKRRRKLIIRRSIAVAMISISWALLRSDLLPTPSLGEWWYGSMRHNSNDENALLLESGVVQPSRPLTTDQCASNGICSLKERPGRVGNSLDCKGRKDSGCEGGGPIRWLQKAASTAKEVLGNDAEVIRV
mmetsp:Transcript_59525/g.88407  ORF Transcript_59525/g.88407 Transcript_59525/m.88407 type:complete len:798 (+) Transcript_59525:1129-3522(+)